MKRLLFLMLCLIALSSLPALAANPIREAHKAMKNAKYEEDENEAKSTAESLNTAEKNLLEALNDEKEQIRRAEIYFTAALIQCKFHEIENTKIYLKKEYDTTLFYNSIVNAYLYAQQCDSTEQIIAADNNGKFKFRPKCRKILSTHRKNLLNGGRFYMLKKDFPQAARFLNLYLLSADYPLAGDAFNEAHDSMFVRTNYWALASNFYAGNYHKVLIYAPAAFRYPNRRQYIQEYVCRSYLALNDSAAWEQQLKKGLNNWPEHDYFFTALEECLARKKKFAEALAYADSALSRNPKNPDYWHARAFATLHLKDYDACISSCNNVLALDSLNASACFMKGVAYCNMAEQEADEMKNEDILSDDYKKHRDKMTELYELAETPLVQARTLTPKKAAFWAPPLYLVYLNLNKGKEFEEIEHIVDKLPDNPIQSEHK